ncbi:TlpA family protein disulfide reductase [Saccharicrinis sp. GN24d3]
MSTLLYGQINQSKPVIICGKILNYSELKNRETIGLTYSSNVHMLNSISEVSDIDNQGYFKFSFVRNMPQDVLIDFLTTFNIFVSPGDSIYFEFLASKNRVDIYDSIKFYGNGVCNNTIISNFNKFYFKNIPSFDLIKRQQTNLSPQQYTLFLDSISKSFVQYSEKLLTDNSVSDTAITWINTAIKMHYMSGLADYPENHRKYNYLKKGEWFVDDDFFNPLINCDVNEMMLFNTDFTGIFVNRYHHKCITYLNQKHLFQKGKGEFKKEGKSEVFITNSLAISFGFNSEYKQAEKEIKSILKFTRENIIRQLIIREYYSENIDHNGFDTYFNENRREVFDKYVTNSLINQQFFDYYTPVKNNSINELANQRELESSSLTDIINKHKGKAIYIDCWGTWCAPCLSEMPYSNLLIEKYKSEDIVFVFICMDSPEDQWKATIDKRNLKGEHYWLNIDKSNKIRADYNISGIPYYFLIDKTGQICNKGNNLKPSQSETTGQIEKLLSID